MAQREKHPSTSGAGEPKAAETILNSVLQELETLHQSMRDHLSEDVERLQTEKNRLIEEIEGLRNQYRQLQSQQVETLSQRYIYQQQLWLKQLAQVMAHNLQELLTQRFNELSANAGQKMTGPVTSGEFPVPMPLDGYTERSSELLASLDATLNRTFETMQRDLSSYESNLSQRLNNLQSLERQGEELLEALVNRLRDELQRTKEIEEIEEEIEDEIEPPFDPRDFDTEAGNNSRGQNLLPPVEPALRDPQPQPAPPPPPPPAPVPAAPKPAASQVQTGLILALASAIVLSLFNVCLRILIKAPAPRTVLGLFQVPGVITPGFGNSLLILLLRLIVVTLLMPVLASFLYPPVWSDLKRFFNSGDQALWTKVIGSAFFLFLSQVFIYIAIGNIPAGIAITIFFIYPIATVLGSWALFGNRPTPVGTGAMFGITLGLIVAASPSLQAGIKPGAGDPVLGIITAIAAGITFAGYVLLTQMAAGKLHPIPFSLVNFFSIFVFSALSLIVLGLGLPIPANWAVNINPNVWSGLLIGGFILGVLTLFSYLLNNYAIRFAGAALASVVGTLGPALTGLFGLIIIGENLKPIQWIGMAIVTASVAAMSIERIMAPKKAS